MQTHYFSFKTQNVTITVEETTMSISHPRKNQKEITTIHHKKNKNKNNKNPKTPQKMSKKKKT